MPKIEWTEMDEEASREGDARKRAFRSAAVPGQMQRGIFSTHKGHGVGAVAPPTTKGVEGLLSKEAA